jgi:WD40 repeat protein
MEAGKGRPAKGQELMLLEGHAGPVLAVAFSPGGKVLASAGADGLRTWALPGGEPLTTPARDAPPVNGLAFSPDPVLGAGTLPQPLFWNSWKTAWRHR